ncbi:MAG TPA: adenylate/guanylate cyclase domain-containing protein, partial [Candidatus Rifleibacterium sp.]|nr:adenylate/guanylate cyclase domain-containing protein [Candidatus Rifleibacterium sp.]
VVAENRSQFPFPVAVGVNLGSVINGFLGVGEKRDFTVIGDAVNVSARIEGQAEKLRYQRCLVSQTVYELVSHDFAAREHGEVELKGKSLPLKVYQLTI